MHAFDRDKLYGTISVRNAKSNEELLTLDKQNRILDDSDLVITDNDKAIALAGVMGGFNSEVTSDTKNLLIESAYFDKVSIMKTSRKLNLISDASIRFERGIDRNIQSFGLERFINLFQESSDIIYSDIQNDSKKFEANSSVKFDKSKITEILGIEIDDKFIAKTLSSLKITYTLNKDTIEFSSPSWRYDLERPIDIIEELAKHCDNPNQTKRTHQRSSVYSPSDNALLHTRVPNMKLHSDSYRDAEKLAAWSKFYTLPKRCRTKGMQSSDFVWCSEYRGEQKRLFEAQWKKRR